MQLPPEGGSVSDTSPGAGDGVGNAVGSTTRIATSSQGDLGAGSVTSTTTLADGELLGGVVRAHDIRIVASADGGRPSAAVTFGSLIVAGISYPNPQPNTRVEVPGVGIVIINEQLIGGDGRDVAAIIVRAVRLQITEPSLFDLPRGTDADHGPRGGRRPGRRRDPAGRARRRRRRATAVPWAPISEYQPVDVSLSNGNGDDDNFDLDNGNGNDNAAALLLAAAVAAARPSTSTTGGRYRHHRRRRQGHRNRRRQLPARMPTRPARSSCSTAVSEDPGESLRSSGPPAHGPSVARSSPA